MTQASGVPDPIPMRIGDAERNSALEALGEHLSAGRLDIDEYGERSAKVTVARTTADLAALFTDLPVPHPAMPSRSTPAVRPANTSPAAPTDPRIVPRPDNRTAGQRWAAAAVPLAVIAAVGLYFLAHVWFVFLLIPVVAVIAGTISGPDNHHRDRRRRELGP